MRNYKISPVIFLENNQTIFRGIDHLYRLRETSEMSVDELVEWQWNSCYPQTVFLDEQTIRYQNPMHLFFEFLKGNPYIRRNEDIGAVCKEDAKKMLQLFCAAAELDKPQSNAKIPGLFEKMCSNMRDIMGSDACYLLYSQRDQTELLSTSSLPAQSSHKQLDQAVFNSMRLYIQKERKKDSNHLAADKADWPLVDTVYVPNMSDLFAEVGEHDQAMHLVSIVLNESRYPQTNRKGEWIYLIFQYPSNVPDTEALLHRVRNLLFMRKKILEHCQKWMYLLLLAQRSYQYVPAISKNSESEPTKGVRILHLTDLHLQPSNKSAVMDFAKNIRGLPEFGEPIDLLLITGDVVQANYSAGLLERNYVIAEEFVRTLAASLWPTEDGYVRPDWQKRIIIIPGNHDYASMNELQAASTPGAKRAIGSGYPARNEGGPMVKFAYYINFICRLFHTDMHTLIENHLNEMRCYRELGISILSLNTVFEAGPLRTNKVLVNMPVAKELIQSTDLRDQFPLLLCHHTPNYPVKYLMDRYWQNCGVPFSVQEKWVNEFAGYVEEILEMAKNIDSARLASGMEAIWRKLNKLQEDIFSNTTYPVHNPEKYDLLWDIVRTMDTINTPPYYSEQIAALCRSVRADQEMAERDRKLLEASYRELLKTMKYQLVLGGHTHKRNYYGNSTSHETNYNDLDPKEIPCVEGDLFYVSGKDQNMFNFAIYNIDKQQVHSREWKTEVYFYKCAYSPGKSPIISCNSTDVETLEWDMFPKM